MAFSSDTLLERMYLKRQLTMWRLIAIAILLFFAVQMIEKEDNISPVSGDFIARITIDDIIVDNKELNSLLRDIKDNENVKAVIVTLDTPGGTAVGGETLYRALNDIRKNKPVVAVMRTVCTSAGYMVSLASDRSFALDSTLTGSIGVIMQAAEFTELAKKIGVTPITLKSGPHKGAPLATEKLQDEQRKALKETLDDFHQVFIDMVVESRDIPEEDVRKIADGRVYSGRQALKLNLIDELGGEKEALEWLYREKNITDKIKVKDMKIAKDEPSILEILGGEAALSFISSLFGNVRSNEKLEGLLLIWHP